MGLLKKSVFLLFLGLSFAGCPANASTLDLFGSPNALFCPDSLKPDASVEDRLVEAYSRMIEIYRGSLTDEEFRKTIESLLESKLYYRLPKGATSLHKGADLAAKIGEAIRHNEFPGGAKLNPESFEERIRTHLEELLGKSRAAVRVVEKSVTETQTVRQPFHVLRGHKKSRTWSQISPDFSKAYSSADDDEKLYLWDLKQAAKVKEYWVPPEVHGRILVNENATQAIGVESGHLLTIWNPQTQEMADVFQSVAMSKFQVNADFTRAVSVSYEGDFTFMDLKGHHDFMVSTPDALGVVSFDVSTDFNYAVAGTDNGEVLFWKVGSKKTPHVSKSNRGRVSAIQFTTDSERVFTGSIFGHLIEWDVKTHKMIQDFGEMKGAIISIRIREDSKQALLGMGHGSVLLVDLESGAILHEFPGHSREIVSAIAVNRDFTRAVSTSYDGTLTLWDLEKKTEIVTLPGHSDKVVGVEVNASFTRALSTSEDGTLILWNLEMASQGGH